MKKEVKKITIDDIFAYWEQMWKGAYIEAYCTGNVNDSDCVKMFQSVESSIFTFLKTHPSL